MNTYYLAIDIGASSGRHIVGWLENGKMQVDEVFRFPNGVTKKEGHLVWDTEALFFSVVEGIKAALKKYPRIKSLAIDTWGCDYVLLNGEKEITPCYAYRDSRTEPFMDKVHAKIPFEELYRRTGAQRQPFNTVYQLSCDLAAGRLENATDFLQMPEYLSYKLTGVKRKEYTEATTTGLVNTLTGEFDGDIIKTLSLPERLFPQLSEPKTVLGPLLPEIEKAVGGQMEVVLCASHDTASAVEGIPMEDDAIYLSSGTWSLFGVKLKTALTDENSLKGNWANEGGVGYIRYLKNIMGMWVVNELKKEICNDTPFKQIDEAARASTYSATVDLRDSAFLAPESMKKAIENAITGEKPQTLGDYFRCVYLSLAECYRVSLEELKANTGREYRKLYIVGGGAKNEVLNEMTRELCKIEVVALPIEATAIGNLKIQANA